MPRPALRLSALAAALLALPACPILTPDNHFEDRPPRIVEEGVQPGGYEVRVAPGAGCLPLAFSAQVEDPDLADSIWYRWFVDGMLVAEDVVHNPAFELLRSEPLTWSVVPRAPSSPLRAPGTYLVELVAADGVLVGREPQPRRPHADDRGDATYADERAWLVTVEPGDACP
jgi:hypothetical protein